MPLLILVLAFLKVAWKAGKKFILWSINELAAWGRYILRILHGKTVEFASCLEKAGWVTTFCMNPDFFQNSNYLHSVQSNGHTVRILIGVFVSLIVSGLSVVLTRRDDTDEQDHLPKDSPNRIANRPWVWALRCTGFVLGGMVSAYTTSVTNYSLLHSDAKALSPFVWLITIFVVLGSFLNAAEITTDYCASRERKRLAEIPPAAVVPN